MVGGISGLAHSNQFKLQILVGMNLTRSRHDSKEARDSTNYFSSVGETKRRLVDLSAVIFTYFNARTPFTEDSSSVCRRWDVHHSTVFFAPAQSNETLFSGMKMQRRIIIRKYNLGLNVHELFQ